MNEFKVGDWIINTTHSKPEPMIVTQAMIEDKSPHNHGSHLELWKPKEGEWCVSRPKKYAEQWNVYKYKKMDDNGNTIYPLELLQTLKDK